MKLDVLIIGQGIAGTIASYQLINKGYTVGIIDKAIPNQSSKLASAIINPLSGKKWNQVTQFNDLLDHSISSYRGIEKLINQTLIHPKNHIYFFQSNEEKELAKQHYNTNWYKISEQKEFEIIKNPFGYAEIEHCFCINQEILFEEWKKYMALQYYFDDTSFDYEVLNFENKHWHYKNIQSNAIIFCEGIMAKQNPFFTDLPFTKNSGDVLYVAIEELDNKNIYTFKNRLVPVKDQLFWLGSNHNWEYNNLHKNKEWAENCIIDLQQQLPYTITLLDHKVAERPTTVGQKPLALLHEKLPNMGLFNGLGTRGFLQASWYCKLLLEQMGL